jgi:thiol-disulfide isomerase/thioredoxin
MTLIDADNIDARFVARPRRDVASVEIDDEIVLAAPIGEGGAIFSHWMNATGACVWKCLDGSTALDELAVDFADAFAVEVPAVLDDLIALCRDLGRAGLLEGVQPEPPAVTMRISTLPTGSDVSGTVGLDLDGNEVRAGEHADRRVLLLNWNLDCGFCRDLLPQLEELAPELRSHGVDIALVGSGATAFTGLGTPVAYLVDGKGHTESQLGMGAAGVADLARRALS